MKPRVYRLLLVAVLALLFSSLPPRSHAQTGSGTLFSGAITDPSGAFVANATVTLVLAQGGKPITTRTNMQGIYQFRGVAPGTYTVTATAKGFAVYVKENVEIRVGPAQRVGIQLFIEEKKEQVVVEDESARVNVDPSSNANAVVISGKDMEALADAPDELESQLAALAGPSAGPNGGQFYVDGFTVEQQGALQLDGGFQRWSIASIQTCERPTRSKLRPAPNVKLPQTLPCRSRI